MLLIDYVRELSQKNSICEQILGRVLHRICESRPDFATRQCKRIRKIDAHDVVVTGIELLADSTERKCWVMLKYPQKGDITIQFRDQNSISGITKSYQIVRFPQDRPCNDVELLCQTDEVLKNAGVTTIPVEYSAA